MAAETTDTEKGFEIDDKRYPVPGVDSFDMDEAQILYDLSGLSLEDFAKPDKGDTEGWDRRRKMMRHPGLLRAFVHIAYRRENRDLAHAEITDRVGTVNYLDALVVLLGLEDKDDKAEDPTPGSTPEREEPSSSTTSSPSESSGPDSGSASDEPEETRVPTGASR